MSPIAAGREQPGDFVASAEVCVIGTGAGGAAAACALAEAGKHVIAVEAGGYHQAPDFDQRELNMLEALYAEDGRRATRDLGIPILCGRAVGGGTAHNTGYVYRAPPAILERWRREAGLEWSEAEAAATYGRAAEAIGVTMAGEQELNTNNALFLQGARALGWRARRTAHNRSGGCSGCGYCMLGCAYNRKQGAAITFVPRLLARGGTVLTDAPARRLLRDGEGWRVEGVLRDAARRPTGHGYTVRARDVVLAAGAIDGPALLQRSGLGGPACGRNLRLHPAAAVAGVFDEPVSCWRGLPQMVMVEEFADFFDHGHGGYLLMPVSTTPALLAPLLPGLGVAHREAMRLAPRLALACVLLHDESRGTVRDRRGFLRLSPSIDYWPDAADRDALARGMAHLVQLLLAAGAREARLPLEGAPPVRSLAEAQRVLLRARLEPHRLLLQSVHPQGTCSLGPDARLSVVRPDQRLHGQAGLYVADTSVFPTSLGVPPQLTAMALGLRAAEVVLGESRR